MRKFLIATGLTMALLAIPSHAQTTAPPTPAIVTQGLASIKRPPDRAWVSVAVESRESKAAEARSKAASHTTTVQAAIKALGIPAEAIKTTSYALQPQLEWDKAKSRIVGYVVRNEFSVRVDNIDRVSEVLDTVGSASTSSSMSVSIGGVRFDLKDTATVEAQALEMATKDALGRAQSLANGAGRGVGTILRIEEQRQIDQPGPRPVYARGLATTVAVDVATPIEPNEIEIRAVVVVTVGIK